MCVTLQKPSAIRYPPRWRTSRTYTSPSCATRCEQREGGFSAPAGSVRPPAPPVRALDRPRDDVLEPAEDGAAPAGRLVGEKAVVTVDVIPAPRARLAVQRTDAEKVVRSRRARRAIVETAKQNPADGYHMVTALVHRALGLRGQPQAGAVRSSDRLERTKLALGGFCSAEPRLGEPWSPFGRSDVDGLRLGVVGLAGGFAHRRADARECQAGRLAPGGALRDHGAEPGL